MTIYTQKPGKTSREKVATPIRKADATTAAEEETRLQVIAHYNYTSVVVGQSDFSALRLWALPIRTPKRKRASKRPNCNQQNRRPMAVKSSIHIKPCNISSSGAHNLRIPEYMRNIGESKIYLIPQLVANNEYWINPRFDDYNLQTHYDNIKLMVRSASSKRTKREDLTLESMTFRITLGSDARKMSLWKHWACRQAEDKIEA